MEYLDGYPMERIADAVTTVDGTITTLAQLAV
jgi:hypothetical protein